MDHHRILVYRDKLFLPSESFIQRAYYAFSDLEVFYSGHLRKQSERRSIINLNFVLDFNSFYRFKSIERFLFHVMGILPNRLVHVLRKREFGVIHAHFGKSGAYALPLSRILNLPLIVTYHGADATKRSHTDQNIFKSYNRRRADLFRSADLILAVSDFIKARLLAQGALEKRVQTHYNGVDPDYFYPSKKENRVVFAGRMVEKKGIDLIVQALIELTQEGFKPIHDWQFFFLGSGALWDQARSQLMHSGIHAEFPGWVSPEQIRVYLSSVKLVLVPSKMASNGDCEGLPMIALEGMMSGAAIISSDHAGLPEAVLDGQTGWIFKEGNKQAFKACLKKALSDFDEVARFGDAGRKRALEQFNLKIQSKKLETLLKTTHVRSQRADFI